MTSSNQVRPLRQPDSAPTDGKRGVHRSGEPIAVIGMACRFPGAGDLDAFWQLLIEGRNAVTEGAPGSGVGRLGRLIRDPDVQHEACRYGAFVDDIDMFDAAFFRISPVEAELLDPQQRMMLETSWLALEDAGIDPLRLEGSRTGVYTGISNDEYRMLVLDSIRPTEAAGSLYALTGTNLNGTSGRVSFVLGLMGPAKAVDAACASAMVAVNDAVADLQQGKADLAIAGGVQALLNGRVYELRAESMMLSPDGQCKTFDADANGYVRGEGCGVVVLKRLSEAEADGDPIWAVIRGSAVNNGGTSIGLTVPHTPALEQVMEAALADAGILPSEVDYVEAHGTGTAVGDPIELEAVASVYGRGRDPDRPILTGSVKTNFGHLESAAGVAGLIKAVLAVKRGVIPKHLHFHTPNPAFDWERHPLHVTATMMDWPGHGRRPRMAGVNSFGITGTNAHIVVEEYRPPEGESGEQHPGATGSAQPVAVALPAHLADVPVEESAQRRTRILPLSAKSAAALGDLARRHRSWLDTQPQETDAAEDACAPTLSDLAWTASVGRSHFEHRKAVVFDDAHSLRRALDALTGSESGVDARTATTVAFVYTGQGSQWVGMGRALYEHEPVARAVMDRCEAVFQGIRGSSLLDVMFGRPGAQGDLGDTAWEQPALYTLECALTALWSSVGIRPDAVLGHSVGELAAAQAAGVFSLEDGMRFAEARGALFSATAPGAMVAVFAPTGRVAAEVDAHNAGSDGAGLSVAADNGGHTVVSGPVEDVEAIVQRLNAAGIRARRLNTTRAFHSALLEPALDALEASLAGVAIQPPALAFVSNLTGSVVEQGTALDRGYWRRHARAPVSFADGVRALAALGVDAVVEIGPHAVLGPMATQAWPQAEAAGAPAVLSSLTRPPRGGASTEPERTFVHAVAQAYEAGLEVSFAGLFAGESRRRISIPGYPFQRERHWVEEGKAWRTAAGHPLLGNRHESARGEITFERELSPSDPAWMRDHRVFGRLVAPGALYGALAATASVAEGSSSIVVEEMQLHQALLLPDGDSADAADPEGRRVQVVLDAAEQGASRRVQIYSNGAERAWTMHAEGRVLTNAPLPVPSGQIDLGGLQARLSVADLPGYYRAKSSTGIALGPSFRTLSMAWAGPGEALGEIRLPEALGRNPLDVHPLLLDGCFQVVGLARNMTGAPGEATYLPFGWQRWWLAQRLPDRLFCHATMSGTAPAADAASDDQPEVLSGELRIYDPSGALLGELSGYTVKRATRMALLSAVEGGDDLLYEVTWRDRPLPSPMEPADFFPSPTGVATRAQLFTAYLSDAGVDPQGRQALLADLEHWSWSRALATLAELGWHGVTGEVIDPEGLRERLQVLPEHRRLFRRMLEMAAKAGVLEERGAAFAVTEAAGKELPDLQELAARMTDRYPHGLIEIGLFQRSGEALARVLRGEADPLTLLFSSGEPTAADLYLKAPVARAANRMIAEAIQALLAELPEGRRLRVIEVGAGTGSATASVLPELPEGRFDYTYTDISAGFFAEAEARFGDGGGSIAYRPLDIERDPVAQGFDSHGYDLLIASNVLHATRYLEETLAHCRALLAPSGHLVALENLRGLGWMDLTFGQLDGWWRFADAYRPHHALASPAVWQQALADAGFAGSVVLGVDDSSTPDMLDKGVIVAQGPAQLTDAPGLWVVTADQGGVAEQLAGALVARNQTVVLAAGDTPRVDLPAAAGPLVLRTQVDAGSRASWRSLLTGLPADLPLSGLVHLSALEGHGAQASTSEIAEDVAHAGASALAMVQAVNESDVLPQAGIWFVTQGAQVLERELGGELAGAVLWGLGKVVTLEAGHLQPRMIDLDPGTAPPISDLVGELLSPDRENHIAYRSGRRLSARLVRAQHAAQRLDLPEGPDWVLTPNRSGVFDRPEVLALPARALEPQEVRVSVEATGLNFWDVFRSLGFIEEGNLGRELCGRVVDIGSAVSTVSIGERVVGLGFGAFAPEMVTREELVAQAPSGMSVSDLATVPSAFVSAALSYRYSGLEAGDRVLIHAGAGGVGLAAIQLAQAAGAEVFATASAPKQAYLRSLGVRHVFDSRQTNFGEEVLKATDGEGVHVVLNSLTSEGFIDASLSCLARGGRFVELARRDILSEEEMAAVRPDVTYAILELDVLKKTNPAWVGEVLREVMGQLSAGAIRPLTHSRWPLSEAGTALGFMRSARHIGKIVLTPPPLMKGRLRPDRTYLVTGGLGGIGIAVAGWLADRGAGAIVLNGRREPDVDAVEAIDALRKRGVRVEVKLADVTDSDAIDAILAEVRAELPPLGGIIHSVGVLSDASLANQTWETFEHVLWPKIKGAWHLHRVTKDLDLDLFLLFSSRVGVMGNPGQANHAAANAFLDQLASHRRALGLPGQAIAWGAWSEIGEAAEQRERIERRRAALGGRWFTPQQGIQALEKLVRQDAATSVVMSMDWSVFGEAVLDRPPLLDELLSSASDEPADDPSSAGDILSRLERASRAERREVLASFLQRELQAVLRLSTTPSPTVGFFDLGMDSLMSVELRNRLNRALAGAHVVSNTAVFDYPNVTALAGHLDEELGQDGSPGGPEPAVRAEPAAPAPRPAAGTAEDAIAIVGMACRFPGAPDVDSFWRLLASGAHAVTDGRPDGELLTGAIGDPTADDVIYRRGGFVDGIDQFDNRFFRISPLEARMMDPQQRMLLETTWQALEDAGINPDRLRGSRTGVYAGIGSSEYRDVIAANGQEDFYFGTSGSMTAGRIAFVLGLEGPAMPVDLACASSLAALHQASIALQRGEVDLALAGGVNATLSRAIMRFHRDMGMLSGIGRCNAFDAAADGFVRSEGCGIVVLKRLSQAEADGDRIWALIRGSAVNQNGASAGLPVPNGPAQERLIADALARAGVQPRDIDYLEAHGAGTELGDSIELRALAAVYGQGRDADNPLLMGSVKTNIGHTEWAAGMASVIKVVMAMHRGVIPAHLHFQNPNPNVDWDRIPIRVTSEETAWPASDGRAPLSAVNAFGLSGANAHVVLEGYTGPASGPASNGDLSWPAGSPRPVQVPPGAPDGFAQVSEGSSERAARLLPLSGKSPEALRALAERFLSWLGEHPGERSADGDSALLADMAWTAGEGRSHFGHRAALVFRDAPELRARLEGLIGSAGADGRAASAAAVRTAFVYPGQGGAWVGMGASLYRTEPVVRAVLDRCDRLVREEQGASLLDVLFGRPGAAGELRDPAWAYPAVYALEAALTALWESIGLQPTRVLGHGVGGIAAAQAAGAVSLEDGLRLAGAIAVPGSALPACEVRHPSLTLVSSVSGRAVQSPEELHDAYWRRLAGEPPAWEDCVEALADAGADLVVEMGPQTTSGPSAAPYWPEGTEDTPPPTFVDGLLLPAGEDADDAERRLLAAVGVAYEAGAQLSFASLYAGEERRRIAVPGYPFQRRRFWVPTRRGSR